MAIPDPIRDRQSAADHDSGPVRVVVAALGRPAGGPTLPEPEEIDGATVVKVCAKFSIQVLGPPPGPFTG